MLHPNPVDLDIRTQEHNRRVAEINRYGWLRSDRVRSCPRTTAHAVLAAVVTRLTLNTSVREDSGSDASLGGAVTGNAALGTV